MTTFLLNDLIFYKNAGGNIMSGGYNVESFMLQKGISPMQTLNAAQYGGKDEKVSSNFENMAVPAGLYYITQPNHKNKEQLHYKKEHTAISDDIFDKLYAMIEYDDKKKRKTKKHVTQQNKKKTKKQKI